MRNELPKTNKTAEKDTATKILDLGEMLIQTRGFNGFSYNDIAKELGIKKASIHYHFPSKTDLGRAAIERYLNAMDSAMSQATADAQEDPKTTSWSLLEFYFSSYYKFAHTPDKVCLSGALAGDFLALPDDMKKHVTDFFEAHQNWIANVVRRGQVSGEFHKEAQPENFAMFLFNGLQGALLIKRATADMSQLDAVVKSAKEILIRH